MSMSKKGRGRAGRGKTAQVAAPPVSASGTVDVDAAIEGETQAIGRELFAHLERRSPSIFERRWWDDRILSWAMADESVKVQMFRFVDVLPMLHTHEAVTRHLQEYFDEVRSQLPLAVRLGLEISQPNSVLGKALALNARSQRPADVAAVYRRREGRRSSGDGHEAPQAGLCLHARSARRSHDQRARRRRVSAGLSRVDRRHGRRGAILVRSPAARPRSRRQRFRGSIFRSNSRPSTASFARSTRPARRSTSSAGCDRCCGRRASTTPTSTSTWSSTLTRT